MSRINRLRDKNRDFRPNATRFSRILALILLFAFIALMRPPAPPVTVGAPQTVTTTIPQLGVHTRLSDEVEPWKIKRTLQLAREMGAPWIVEFFPWAYFEPEPGEFRWQQADLIIDHAEAQGLTVIARLGLTPYWARPADTPDTFLAAAAYDDFAAFSAAFAERYRGRVDYIIVGNEPNLSFEWGMQPVNSADYVALLHKVYPAIKMANPDAVVLAGALAPTLEPPGSANGLNDLLYLEELYAQGADNFFDALAVHTYGFTFPPDAEPGPDLLNFRRVELLRDIMIRYGDGDTPIYITETGYNDHPRWSLAVSPAERIRYSADSIRYAISNWPYVDVIVLWKLRTPYPDNSYRDYYTLVTPEFVEKPIYTELKRLTGNE
ncbi:MAG: beta-galactosidase [Anaerolineae bacterium]|nr:beta-galactosidase [Anaerolineae bacterium]MCO5205381.1 beta-galactosidase [Anaerolineae bacterium]